MSITRLGQIWQKAKGTGRGKWSGAGSLGTVAGAFPATRQGAVAKFLTIALTGALLMGLGCNAWRSERPVDPLSYIRPPAMETARLLSNAHYYKLMGRPEVALKELEQAHQADPGNLKIVDTLAQSYQEIGDFQRAQELYQEALAHFGANQAITNNLCFSYYFQGNLAKAEACFKEALVRDPDNAAARNNLGLVWCRQGKLAEAQRLWEQAEGGKAAENHLNQALAFLGMSTPAHYAKSPEPKAESRPQLASSTEPAAPANLASAAKIRAAEMPIPEKQAPVPAPAMHPKAAVKEVAKRLEPKPEAKPQLLATPKPAAPVVLASTAKPEPARAQAPVQATRPLPLAALPAKAALTEAKKPAELRPELRPQPAKSPKPSAPVILAAAAQPPVATAAPAMQPKPVVKAAAQPVKPQPEAKPQLLATPGPAAPVVLASTAKPEPARALAPVQAARPLPLAALPAKAALTEAKNPAEPRPELRPQPAKSQMPSAPVILAAAAQPPVATPAPAMQPKPVVKAAAKPMVSSAPLTAAERAGAGIELRNGTRTKFLAHHARSLLRREGFKVTQIGNYIDFGAVTTTIYYRPGAERVARALGSEFFPGAGIEPSSSLNKKSTIKVVLGRDFVDQPRLAARAAGSKTVAPPPAGEAKPLEVGTQVMPAASKEPAAPVTLAAPSPIRPR